MNELPPCILRALALAVGFGLAIPALHAQAVPASTTTKDGEIVLNPFEVQATPDDSYGALNSNAITRFNVELNKLPLSADVYDQAFMSDVGAMSVEDMITGYSAGAGFAGADPAGGGQSGASTAQPGDYVVSGRQQLRGLGSPRVERDSLMPLGSYYNPGGSSPNSTSLFDVERVDVINGPQALLYSGGGAGGVINVTSKQAYLGRALFGNASYQIDNYGSKTGMFDVGAGNNRIALRLSTIAQSQRTRRTFIGNTLYGYYGQLAFKLGNTTFRLSGEQSFFSGIAGAVTTFTSGNIDPRNGLQLRYLLATNQAGATNPITGAPYPQGAIDNGHLNWENVDSELGWHSGMTNLNTWGTFTADSRWTSWLSTEFVVAYNGIYFDRVLPRVLNYDPPGNTGSGLGAWAVGEQYGDVTNNGRNKGIRFSALATNDLFGGRVHSQTFFGGDFTRVNATQIQYGYFQADANWNVLRNPATQATNDGRTISPEFYWAIPNGPIKYPFSAPREPRVTMNGVNYVRGIQNEIDPARISPANPVGWTNTNSYGISKLFNRGIFAVNYSEWLQGKLTTLAGVRVANAFDQGIAPSGFKLVRGTTTNVDVGATYALKPWLRAYADFSTAFEPPTTIQYDPVGNLPKIAHSQSEEVGLKVSSANNALSASLSVYHTHSKNEQYEISSTLQNDIQPTGLNGVGPVGQWLSVDMASKGAQLALTANPMPNWRLRFTAAEADGTILNNVTYPHLYNDQFHTNSSGQVTYADGAVVYVAPTFNAATPAYTQQNAPAGAVPLTVTKLSTPGDPYFANPLAISGQITSTTNAAKVLTRVDPVHGAILTGNIAQPISAYQLNPALAGISVPSSILVANAGDKTMGYPKYSLNLTSKYTFTEGFVRGFSLGGTVASAWQYGKYYYYPTGVPTGPREVFGAPTNTRLDLIAGYSHKFRKTTWSVQLNVYNMFNHYTVLVLPDEVTGWTVPTRLNANLVGLPRAYQLRTSFSF